MAAHDPNAACAYQIKFVTTMMTRMASMPQNDHFICRSIIPTQRLSFRPLISNA